MKGAIKGILSDMFIYIYIYEMKERKKWMSLNKIDRNVSRIQTDQLVELKEEKRKGYEG